MDTKSNFFARIVNTLMNSMAKLSSKVVPKRKKVLANANTDEIRSILKKQLDFDEFIRSIVVSDDDPAELD